MQIHTPTLVVLRKAKVAWFVAIFHLVLSEPLGATLEPGVYQTVPEATVEECGDRLLTGDFCLGNPNFGRRVVPLSATLTFDLDAAQPSLTAVIHNAVLEGSDPFRLTVRSSFGARDAEGSYRFTGDYLGGTQPAGSGYLFDWRFSTTSDERVVWNGIAAWSGGHFWQVTTSDIAIGLVPEPRSAALAVLCICLFAAFRASQTAGGLLSRVRPLVRRRH